MLWFSAHPIHLCLRRAVLLVIALVALLGAAQVRAQAIDLREWQIEWQDNSWQLNANAEFELPPVLVDAVNKGISLVFVTDYEVYHNRWYWFDEKVLSGQHALRLTYQPLTRQYFVAPRSSTGGLQQRFGTLREALGMIRRVRHVRMAERNQLRSGDTYQIALRMRLDTAQLPKPLQVNALNTADWNLSSDWRRFTLTLNAGGEARR